MDRDFLEEKENLARIERQIDEAASRCEKKAKEDDEKAKDFYCIDYEDREKLRDLVESSNRSKKRGEEFRAQQESPYFGRLDLDRENNPDDPDEEPETITVFVGKESVIDRSNVIVVDWRSKLGECYYANNQRQFTIGEKTHTLALKRSVVIEHAKLISCQTDYDGTVVTLEGEVIDPFLLTVLKDKRRHNRLTDIIRTIQGNQNEIIRRPLTESFGVQGCAGSGKTMILLHRLSYLKFNNRTMSMSGVKIITPNRTFGDHINGLSAELGLGAIERVSVEEYYASLIKRLSGKKVDPQVVSEKLLNPELLREIYSVEYQEQSLAHYHAYWTEILSQIDSHKLELCFQLFGLKYPDITKHTEDTYSRLKEYIAEMLRKITARKKKNAENLSRAKSAQAELLEIGKKRAELKVQTDQLVQTITAAFLGRKEKKSDELSECVDQIAGLAEKISRRKQRKKIVGKQLEEIGKILKDAQEKSDRYISSLKQSIEVGDEVGIRIKKECAGIIEEIESLNADLARVPIFNFSKKNTLKNRLAALRGFTIDKLREINEELEGQKNLLGEASGDEEKLEGYREVRRGLERELSGIKRCLNAFTETAWPDPKAAVSDRGFQEDAQLFKPYAESLNEYKQATNREANLKNTLSNLKSELTMEPEVLEQLGYEEFLRASAQTLNKLQLRNILGNVQYKDMRAKYSEYGQEYRKSNYRHRIYLKLLLCTFYCSPLRIADNFLNIDEAQDISVAEYKLLRGILGKGCVFNLYGDINQLVYSYKGITAWEDIEDITTGNVYVLNENYRNTLQITNFCNEEFGAEVYPIGISGEAVVEQTLDEAVQWIINVKRENPSYRAAIVYRHGIKDIKKKLHELLPEEETSWEVVDDQKVSVVSVETAKGLEFEAVVAVVAQMSTNEKYISYTRALDLLSVVRDNFTADLIEEEATQSDDPESFAGEADDVDETEEIEEVEEDNLEDSVDVATDVVAEEGLDDVKQDAEAVESRDDLKNDEAEHELIEDVDTSDKDDISEETLIFIASVEEYLSEKFDEDILLNSVQKQVISKLLDGNPTAFNATSGSMKSVLLYVLALNDHNENGKQSIVTAEAHLQENELVLAERLGLRPGVVIGDTLEDFKHDFKRDKYDVIFVPYDFFDREEARTEFADYFANKIAYWGFDHPKSEDALWPKLRVVNALVGGVPYLMSKEGFGDLDLEGFAIEESDQNLKIGPINKMTFMDRDEKLKWMLEHADEFYGQGLIYCNSEADCRIISKALRKKKIKAETYADVFNEEKIERVNYLTSSFSKGGMPILVTTQEIGKNLTNPNIRFIVHFDVPTDSALYELHITQIGRLAERPVVWDLNSVES